MIEIYKTKNRLNPPCMMKIFDQKAVPYRLRCKSILNLPKMRATYYGTHQYTYMRQRAWAKLPTEIKTSKSLTVFKNF